MNPHALTEETPSLNVAVKLDKLTLVSIIFQIKMITHWTHLIAEDSQFVIYAKIYAKFLQT